MPSGWPAQTLFATQVPFWQVPEPDPPPLSQGAPVNGVVPQVPLVQVGVWQASPEQTVPQLPQLLRSVATLVQAPWQ